MVLNDLCSVNDGSTSGSFDSVSGNYAFSSTDIQNFPPGQYTIKITGTEGSISAEYVFTFSLVDPCPNATLSLINPSPFVD